MKKIFITSQYRRYRFCACVLILCLFSFQLSFAQAISGKCVGVSDGDTITMLIEGHTEKIRLYGIDCPEKNQPFGQRAKQLASNLVFGKDVNLDRVGIDRYGRTIGRVYIEGKSLNEELIRAGLAWHYKQYSSDSNLAVLEREARLQKKGLWVDPQPLPPWEFRKAKRGASSSGGDPQFSLNALRSAEAVAFRGNTKSKVFHRAGCKQFNCRNCTAEFASREAAISVGYRVCGVCRP